LTEKDHAFLWLSRVRAIRVEPEKEVKIPSLLLDYLRKHVSYYARQKMTSITEGGPEITLEDYFTAAIMLGVFARKLQLNNCDKTEQQISEIKKAFDPIARQDYFVGPYIILNTFGQTLNKKYHTVQPGTCLLEYHIDNTLIGYFLIEAVSGVALIKTFLFVTNSGTPEGSKLDRILKARKEDKEFTGIDKLGTLLTTDILQNPTLHAALTEAGLESLIRFCETYPRKTACKKGFNSFFDHYMGLPKQSQEQMNKEIEEEVTV
jgi:hypothetical protein